MKYLSVILLCALILLLPCLTVFAESANPLFHSYRSIFLDIESYYGDSPTEDIYLFCRAGVEALIVPNVGNQIMKNDSYFTFHIDDAIKDFYEILNSEAASYKASGEYHWGIVKAVFENEYVDGNDYLEDPAWLSVLVNQYKQSAESQSRSTPMPSPIINSHNTSSPTAGVDIINFTTAYYMRKMKICGMIETEFSFGASDFCSEGTAIIDGYICTLNENNHISRVMVEDKNAVENIPAIYALRDDVFMEQLNELSEQYGVNWGRHWLTSYEGDFSKLKAGTIENPATWGDYKCCYFKNDKTESGIPTYYYVFVLNEQ